MAKISKTFREFAEMPYTGGRNIEEEGGTRLYSVSSDQVPAVMGSYTKNSYPKTLFYEGTQSPNQAMVGSRFAHLDAMNKALRGPGMTLNEAIEKHPDYFRVHKDYNDLFFQTHGVRPDDIPWHKSTEDYLGSMRGKVKSGSYEAKEFIEEKVKPTVKRGIDAVKQEWEEGGIFEPIEALYKEFKKEEPKEKMKPYSGKNEEEPRMSLEEGLQPGYTYNEEKVPIGKRIIDQLKDIGR